MLTKPEEVRSRSQDGELGDGCMGKQPSSFKHKVNCRSLSLYKADITFIFYFNFSKVKSHFTYSSRVKKMSVITIIPTSLYSIKNIIDWIKSSILGWRNANKRTRTWTAKSKSKGQSTETVEAKASNRKAVRAVWTKYREFGGTDWNNQSNTGTTKCTQGIGCG